MRTWLSSFDNHTENDADCWAIYFYGMSFKIQDSSPTGRTTKLGYKFCVLIYSNLTFWQREMLMKDCESLQAKLMIIDIRCLQWAEQQLLLTPQTVIKSTIYQREFIDSHSFTFDNKSNGSTTTCFSISISVSSFRMAQLKNYGK